jgi:hypothetical protein
VIRGTRAGFFLHEGGVVQAGISRDDPDRLQLHAALGALARVFLKNIGILEHGAHVGDIGKIRLRLRSGTGRKPAESGSEKPDLQPSKDALAARDHGERLSVVKGELKTKLAYARCDPL